MRHDPIRTPGYVAFAIGICITIWTCLMVVDAQDAQIRGNFARDTEKVAADTSARLRTYFDVLLSLQGLFAVTGEVDGDQFSNFVRQLRLSERYPGFRAIQFVRAVPAADLESFAADVQKQSAARNNGAPPFVVHPALVRDEHYIIEFNEPTKGNEDALGLDVASMPSQLEAVRSARDSGRIVATGRTLLVQDTTRQPGFIAHAPIYRQNMPAETVEQRRAAFIGVVSIVFRVEDLLREVIEPSLLRNMALRIIDAGDADAPARPASHDDTLYDSLAPGARTLASQVAQGNAVQPTGRQPLQPRRDAAVHDRRRGDLDQLTDRRLADRLAPQPRAGRPAARHAERAACQPGRAGTAKGPRRNGARRPVVGARDAQAGAGQPDQLGEARLARRAGGRHRA
jgi:CHASE1-domain containing sensor protein